MTKPIDIKKTSAAAAGAAQTKARKSAPKTKAAAKPVKISAAAATKKGPVKTAAKAMNKASTKTPAKPLAKPAPKSSPAGNGASLEAPTPAKAAKPAAKASPAEPKVKKPKLVRDSFTMPAVEYQILGEVKKAALQAGFNVKKSELLRIGVALIKSTGIEKIKAMVGALPPLKAGRPKSDE